MNKIKEIQTIAKELFDSVGINISNIQTVTDHELQTVIVDIKTPEHGLFAYNNGELVQAMNQVARSLFERRFGSDNYDNSLNYIIDVNGEQSKHLADIKTKVRLAAKEAEATSGSVALEPMTSYERLLVHTFLAKHAKVSTESAGEGSERHVIITFIVAESEEA